MRDLVFVAFLAALFAGGFRKPFLFVLTYVYIDIVSPQRLTYMLLNSVPISLIAVALCVLSWILVDDKKDSRVAPRQFMILLLLLYCYVTTLNADFPVEARDKWDWVWKSLAFAAFLPLTLRTRLRIEALLLFMILGASSIIMVGGIKTLASGGGYGELNLMVSNNSGLYEGSIISTVAITIIPLILWFSRFGTIFPPDWKVKVFCYALVFACLLYLGILGAIALVAVPFLPSAFTARMGTIKTYKADESASTRVAVWKWTWEYAKTHPFGGGFETYRQNVLRYDLVSASGSGSNVTVASKVTTDKARAYHSSYFEMLGEQGYPGLALWLAINLIGIFRMEILRHRYRRAPPDQAWVAPLASALQSGHLIYLLGAAFVGIALSPFVYMLIGAQIALDTYLARKRSEMVWRPMRARRPATPQTPAAI